MHAVRRWLIRPLLYARDAGRDGARHDRARLCRAGTSPLSRAARVARSRVARGGGPRSPRRVRIVRSVPAARRAAVRRVARADLRRRTKPTRLRSAATTRSSVVAKLALDTPYNRILRARSGRRAARLRVADARPQRFALQHARHRGSLSEPGLLRGRATPSGPWHRAFRAARRALGRLVCGGRRPPRNTRPRAAAAASPFTSADTRRAPHWRRSMRCARSTTPSCRGRKGSTSSPPQSASRRSRCSRT